MFSYLQQFWTNVYYFWYENTYLSSSFSVVSGGAPGQHIMTAYMGRQLYTPSPDGLYSFWKHFGLDAATGGNGNEYRKLLIHL